MIDEKTRMCFNRQVSASFYLARLLAPQIAACVLPGQFVSLRVGAGLSQFLRLPLSVCRADRDQGTVDVLYEDVGPKTQALSRVPAGGEVPCLGPLGKGFRAPAAGTRAVLVGGGIGIPPLLFLGETLRKGVCEEVVLLTGARTALKQLPDSLLEVATSQVYKATDDGSSGHHGLVTDLLQRELENHPCSTVYTCGPHAMMKAVARRCRDADVECQASLEEYMACGFGVCVGCVVRVVAPEGASPYGHYQRICMDGPVFDARQVCWEE